MLNGTVPAGSTIKLQKDGGNAGNIAIDFINTRAGRADRQPGPGDATSVPAGFDQQDVQNALDTARQDTTASSASTCRPATTRRRNKFQVYGKAIQVVGAGPWYTRFYTPQNQNEHRRRLPRRGQRRTARRSRTSRSSATTRSGSTARARCSTSPTSSNITIDNIWTEHTVCLYWGANTDHMTIKNSRIRNMFADGINMTNGSTDNLVDNNDARATGDDSFALFSAIDAGGVGRDQQRLREPVQPR